MDNQEEMEAMDDGLKCFAKCLFFLVLILIAIQIGIHEGRKLEREAIINGDDLPALEALSAHQAQIAPENAKEMAEANRKGADQ